MKFLGVLLDDNLSCYGKKTHTHIHTYIIYNTYNIYNVCVYIYIYIFFFLLALCYSYIHSNLNYANLAWGSTCRSNLKTIRNQQKHAI